MIINAKDLIVGRMATVVAKKALLGEKVDIVNCQDTYMTGKSSYLHGEYKRRSEQGTFKGPFLPKMPDRFVRRVIRGMLPYKQEKGKKAFARVMCYVGIPKEFEGKEMVSVDNAHISKVKNMDYLQVKDICKKLGTRE